MFQAHACAHKLDRVHDELLEKMIQRDDRDGTDAACQLVVSPMTVAVQDVGVP